LALLGEACRGVSSELREAHPEIPWPQIVGFRTAQLWQATVNLRGSIEPADYKRYVLPIIFLRFLSLRYERRRAELERLIADPASEHYTTDPRVAADIPVSYQQGASAPFAITGILQNDSEEERRQDGVYARLSANLATSSRLRNSETRPPSAA
jgi:type I restriction-modification system DNA methylase subunit